MKRIYSVKVEIPNGALRLEKTLYFSDPEHRASFIATAAEYNWTVKGSGIDHLLSANEAVKECEREASEI